MATGLVSFANGTAATHMNHWCQRLRHKCIKIVDFGLSNRFESDQLLKTACAWLLMKSKLLFRPFSKRWTKRWTCFSWIYGLILPAHFARRVALLCPTGNGVRSELCSTDVRLVELWSETWCIWCRCRPLHGLDRLCLCMFSLRILFAMVCGFLPFEDTPSSSQILYDFGFVMFCWCPMISRNSMQQVHNESDPCILISIQWFTSLNVPLFCNLFNVWLIMET